MAVYGLSTYGQDTYGSPNEPLYRIEPFTCASFDYESILVTWTRPVGSAFAYRLLRNRYGYPSDQDDGDILIDSVAYPGNQFKDTSVIPGQYHYYAFFIQTNNTTDTWVRSGLTACLAIQNFKQFNWLLDRIPAYFTNTAANGTEDELTADPTGNLFLLAFLRVIAFGLDYLKTQYNSYTEVNNPWFIPLDDLYNLGSQLGLNINPDISSYTLRKAIFFNAVINQQRGTLNGLETEISALTGWNSNLQTSQNFMLENDQSAFLDPSYRAWSPYQTYSVNERVSYQNYYYQCIAPGNLGNAPTGLATSNTWWQPQIGAAPQTNVLANSKTGFLNTWEVLTPGNLGGSQPTTALTETIGVPDPLNLSSFTKNALTVTNTNGSTQTMWLRSVARLPTQPPLNIINPNPMFNGGSLTGYVVSLGTMTAVQPGGSAPYTWAAQVTPSAQFGALNTAQSPVVPNQTYLMSFYLNGSATETFQFGVNWNSSVGFISPTVQNTGGSTASTWVFVQQLFTAPINAVSGSFFVKNASGTPHSFMVQNFNITPYNFAVDPSQAIGDGIPVPYSNAMTPVWNTSTFYLPGTIVTFNNLPFIALKESKGQQPPNSLGINPGTPTDYWACLSFSTRYQLVVSAYSQGTAAIEVDPFVEYYDAQGNFICRNFARHNSTGFYLPPTDMSYFSFDQPPSAGLAYLPATFGGNELIATEGVYASSPVGTGIVYPQGVGERCIATTTNTDGSDGWLGITFVTNPPAGQDQGLVLRWTSNGNYIRAGMGSLKIVSSGVPNLVGNYSTAAKPGDRLTVNCAGPVITCYVNNVEVFQANTPFNQTSTTFGIATETA